jgi:hypothetical protein
MKRAKGEVGAVCLQNLLGLLRSTYTARISGSFLYIHALLGVWVGGLRSALRANLRTHKNRPRPGRLSAQMRSRAPGASPGDGASHPYAMQPKLRIAAQLLPKKSRPGPMREVTMVTRWAILPTGATTAGPTLPPFLLACWPACPLPAEYEGDDACQKENVCMTRKQRAILHPIPNSGGRA